MRNSVTVSAITAPLGGVSLHRGLAALLVIAGAMAVSSCGDGPSSGGSASDTGQISASVSLRGSGSESIRIETEFVGRMVCEQCHDQQAQLWRDSHHDLAMQEAAGETVLGDFNDAVFKHQGSSTRFFRHEDQWLIQTEGTDGKPAEFPVRYTFGVYPLQQYLVELPNGKLQALSVAWDSRSKDEGGQRWFHVYGDDYIDHTDVLHWTQPSQNWETMCADCHSTGLVKRYDLEQDRFDTSWEEIDVSCEACHGPGQAHVAWAGDPDGRADSILYKASGKGDKASGRTDRRLAVSLDERRGVNWRFNDQAATAMRSAPGIVTGEVTACAPCHSRRSRISAEDNFGGDFLDAYMPALIESPLYYMDGQIQDEVYVYGSFLQSRMHQQGVTCSDCHDPHSLELRAPASEVCAQCHRKERYAAEEHTLHAPDSTGASCIECHMPPTTYMQVDPRHDHSLRVPRLELTAALSLPDPCTRCHTDKDAAWALDVMRQAGRGIPQNASRWSELLAISGIGSPDSGPALLGLVSDEKAPAILRASALSRVPILGEQVLEAISSRYIADEEPMLRWAVARVLQNASVALQAKMAPSLLDDPVKAVRLAAAVTLAPVGTELISFQIQQKRSRVLEEYVESQLVNSERAESHTNIANIYRYQNRFEAAELAYQTALRLNPFFVPAYVNLVDLYRASDRDDEGETLLHQALTRLPEQASLHHALGLLYVRQQRMADAQNELRKAANAENAELGAVLAFALVLDAQGKTDEAARYLDTARSRFGDERTLISTLVNLYQRSGNEAAIRSLQQ